tara:strand:- start:586 stop:741 length:156 start_codon:yes stop_codon:yes gene_type:complete
VFWHGLLKKKFKDSFLLKQNIKNSVNVKVLYQQFLVVLAFKDNHNFTFQTL